MKDLVSVQRTSNKGLGIYAIRDINKDEVITEFTGPVVTIPEFDGFPDEVVNHLFNIGVDKYIMAREPAVRTNHSCEFNAGIVKDVFLAASTISPTPGLGGLKVTLVLLIAASPASLTSFLALLIHFQAFEPFLIT